MTAPIRSAAVYARVSTEKQNPLSPDDQVRKCREYARSHGFQVLDAHIYRDEGLSGAGADRPGLTRLLDAALSPARPFDAILVDDTSRLSRSTQDALSIFARLNFAGVQLVAVSQGIDSAEDQAEVLVTVHGMVDSLYVRELAKKTHRGLESKMLRGLHAGGRCFGYSNERLDPEKPDAGVRLVVNEEEAEVVRRIFGLSGNGHSLRNIARTLNHEGVAAPRPRRSRPGGGWCPTAIREMLRNERYVGRIVWNKHRFVKAPGTNRRVAKARPREEWRITEAPDLRIVDDKTWEAVRQRQEWLARTFADTRAKADGRGKGLLARDASSKYLLSGLLRCAECGSRLTIISGRAGASRYGCPRNFHRGTCGNRMRERHDRIEQRLLAELQGKVLQPAAVDYVVQQAAKEIARREKLAGSSADRRANLERELRNYTRALADGYSPAIAEEIKKREAELTALAAAPSRESMHADLTRLRVFVVAKLSDLRAVLRAGGQAARAALRNHLGEIVMRPVTEGNKRIYRVSSAWDYSGNLASNGRPSDRPFEMVAGAGFEPATSGL